MSGKCNVCKDPLPPDDFVKCTANNCKLHYECSGISEKTYRQMGSARRDSYKCRLCRDDTSASSDVQKKTEKTSAKTQITLDDLFVKMDNSEIAVKQSIKEVKESVCELQTSVSFCTDKIDDFIKELKQVNDKLKEVAEENKSLAEKNAKLEDKVCHLEQEVQEMQQYSRRFNIQLDGIPEMHNERAMDIVNKLATVVDEPIIINQDIQAAHRLPSNKSRRVPSFLIQFSNKQKRDAVYKKARKKDLVSLDFVSDVPETPVYCNDHLTPYYKKLLYETKQVKKEKKYEFVWVINGKILAKKDKNSTTLRIETFKDIEKM